MVLFLASMIEDNETLETGSETDHSEDQEYFLGEVIQPDYHMPDVITVSVQTGKCCFCMFINKFVIMV